MEIWVKIQVKAANFMLRGVLSMKVLDFYV